MESGVATADDRVACSCHTLARTVLSGTQSSPHRTEQSSLPALASRGERGSAIPTGSLVIIMGKKSWDWMGLSRYFQRMLLCIRMGTARVPPPPRPVRARGKTEDSDDKKKIDFSMWQTGTALHMATACWAQCNAFSCSVNVTSARFKYKLRKTELYNVHLHLELWILNRRFLSSSVV